MKVLLVLEFDNVAADSDESDQILADIHMACKTIATGFDASACYVQECYEDETYDEYGVNTKNSFNTKEK